MANIEWINIFQYASVNYLTRIHSDHCPIKLELHKRTAKDNKIFRIESMWTMHPTFRNLVQEFWSNQINILEAIDNFTKNVLVWNKNTFGNILYKKNKIMVRLEGI